MNSELREPSNPDSPWAEAECGFDRISDVSNIQVGGLWKDKASSGLRPSWTYPHR